MFVTMGMSLLIRCDQLSAILGLRCSSTLPSCRASSSKPTLARMTFCSLVISVSSRTPRPGAAHPDHSAPGLGSRFSLMTPSVRSSVDYCSFGGVDVSQDRLDVLLLPQGTGFSVANDEAGWSTLIGRLRGLLLTAIGLEPSGGYERGVLRALLAAGLSVRRINPNRLRQFARARGALAKNDRLDARLIAEYVATMPTHVVRHDPAAARIAEIVTMRRQLCDE